MIRQFARKPLHREELLPRPFVILAPSPRIRRQKFRLPCLFPFIRVGIGLRLRHQPIGLLLHVRPLACPVVRPQPAQRVLRAIRSCHIRRVLVGRNPPAHAFRRIHPPLTRLRRLPRVQTHAAHRASH